MNMPAKADGMPRIVAAASSPSADGEQCAQSTKPGMVLPHLPRVILQWLRNGAFAVRPAAGYTDVPRTPPPMRAGGAWR